MNVNTQNLDRVQLVLDAISDVKRQIRVARANGASADVEFTLQQNLLSLENCLVTETELLLAGVRYKRNVA